MCRPSKPRLRLLQVYERMQEINAASAEARASKILHGLGFTEVMQKRATHLFSGGWRMRISLARALYIQPTVLLLVRSAAAEPDQHRLLHLHPQAQLLAWRELAHTHCAVPHSVQPAHPCCW